MCVAWAQGRAVSAAQVFSVLAFYRIITVSGRYG
jgi:hypothetical protein